ncbi:TetR/AcrR family transcriptional regulator [Parasutterella excrementihominis]|uniref:TetR/AcrR family transcriptional regulator n=1 Tax=Parasutterella excrementihominis TaxID=487175 RepID=UPI0035200C46
MLKTRETRVEERKEEKRSEKRDRILRAAEAIFLDKGFHAASMNEIAEAANVSTPHLYNFYASKAALALAVQLKMGQETFDALKTAMSAGEKNPSCQSIFDSRRSSLMLTILTECTRNPEIKEKITENGARLWKMISEAGGISPDDQEGQYRMAMYLGMSISNIFTPVENRELMTKVLAQAETCILPFCGDKGSKATVS